MSHASKVRCLTISLITLALAACSGSAEPGEPAPAPNDGTAKSDGSVGSAPSSSPEAPKDGNVATAAAFHPYAIGHKWTWKGKNDKGREVVDTSEVTGKLTVDGRPAFVLSRTTTRYGASAPPTSFTSYAAAEGDDEWTRPDREDAEWARAQKAPLTDGASWSSGVETYTAKREGAQAVPAGTFEDCWRIMLRISSAPDQINDRIVCRGVGVVREIMKNPSGASLDLVLTDKNF